MGVRYTAEQLMRLRESPLVTKPPGLPPAEEWMGPPSDTLRIQSKPRDMDRAHTDRPKLPLMDQTSRRPGLERHISRTNANPEEIVLGPPKTSFASATSRSASKTLDSSDRPPLHKDSDSRDRYSFRRGGDMDEERVRDSGRGNGIRVKRGEGDQDSDGWSTVKPRKSFGTEGAERFNGRMGGDRHKDDRRFRDREDRDHKDKPARGFDTFLRDKEGDQEQEAAPRRNGVGRGRNEPSWFRDKDISDTPALPGDRRSNGDKFGERSRGWREKEREDRTGDRGEDRGDRRWERDRRQERDPEWMDEPVDEKKQAHTQEDFQKWKERMKAGSANTRVEEAPQKPEPVESSGQSSFFGLEKPKVETPLVLVDSGPDKFFGLWAQPKPEGGSENSTTLEGTAKSKILGKSSRFTSFFAPQEDPQRRETEPPPTVPYLPQQENNAQASKEKEDFQKLLLKLQSQSITTAPSTSPAAIAAPQPKFHPQEKQPIMLQSPESFQQYRSERQDGPPTVNRNSQQALQDLLGQRQSSVSQPSARPEQMLQELVNQRQNALSQSSSRQDQMPNRNAEFLMGLMQNARAAPEPIRAEQLMMRAQPQQQIDRQLQQQHQQQLVEREQDIQRERRASQQQRRPEMPPVFFDDSIYQRGPQPQHDGPPNLHSRSQAPPQPTQILQRPPPGLDQLPPSWGAPNAQMPPPMSQQQQQRHIAPPPGLPGGPNRGMPMPQNMFPPGFPIAGFGPPPEAMIGTGGLRNMPLPPPGFMMPPPGFMGGSMGPVNVGVGAFQGQEMAFGGGLYDGRGAPQGGFRRQ